ncbi:MAG: S41 family peptidase [Candidatus Campbellbacteria bacterium]|nr:S41 family peptidase [Candidatus Campbellbacteria bacterium]
MYRRSSKNRKRVRIITDVLIGFAVGVGVLVSEDIYSFKKQGMEEVTRDYPTNQYDVDLDLFWETWQILDESFIPNPDKEKVTDEEKVEGAIRGLVSSFGDPYTTFLPKKDREKFISDIITGQFGGVGIHITTANGLLTIVAPLKGTPAEKAGLQGKDIITKIDGVDARGISTEEAVERIRGERGTKVTLTIIREGREPFDVDVVRDIIRIPSIQASIRSDGIFIIEIINFSVRSISDFRLALREFIKSDAEALIIDLRNNPGGLLEASVEMASFFLPFNEVVLYQTPLDGRGEDKAHISKGYNVFKGNNPPMAILVNEGTASASEILAGALEHHNVGTIIGTKTFGKGSVQRFFELQDEASLKVTISHWKTADGTFISGDGIEPSIIVKDDRDTEVDEVVERAVKFLKEKI